MSIYKRGSQEWRAYQLLKKQECGPAWIHVVTQTTAPATVMSNIRKQMPPSMIMVKRRVPERRTLCDCYKAHNVYRIIRKRQLTAWAKRGWLVAGRG